MDFYRLPEFWYVTINNNNFNVLNDWAKTKNFKSDLYNPGIVGYYSNLNYNSEIPVLGTTDGKVKNDNFDFGTKITFEVFKKYVLKQEEQLNLFEPIKLNKEILDTLI